jgi:hypothetical protein
LSKFLKDKRPLALCVISILLILVGWSAGRLVGWSAGRLVGWSLIAKFNWLIRKLRIDFIFINTDDILGVSFKYFRIEIAAVLIIASAISFLSLAAGRLPSHFKRRKAYQSDRQQKRTRIYLVLSAALIAVLAAAGLGRLAGYSAGQDLIADPDNFSMKHAAIVLLLGETIPLVYVIPVNGDKLGLCMSRKDAPHIHVYLLGRNNNGSFVLVFKANQDETDGRVVFLSDTDYGLVAADYFPESIPLEFSGSCHSRGIYNDPDIPIG